jgi:hypothetical protein
VSVPSFSLLMTLTNFRLPISSAAGASRRLQTPGLSDASTASRSIVVHHLSNADMILSTEENQEQTLGEVAKLKDPQDANMKEAVETNNETHDTDNGAKIIALSISDKSLGGFDGEIDRTVIHEESQNVAQGLSSYVAKITSSEVRRVEINPMSF